MFDGIDELGAEVVDGVAGPAPETNGKQRRRRGEGDKVDRNAGIEPKADLDFIPEGKTALKEFFALLEPASDQDQVLVITYYLEHKMDQQGIGPGHILAGFRHVGKPVPVDLKQTIRNLKKKVWLNFGKSVDNIRVATEGVNHVEHTLGKDKIKPK